MSDNRIREVTASWISCPIPEEKQHVSDFGRMQSFDMCLVTITLESGLTGYGEAKAAVGSQGSCRSLASLINGEITFQHQLTVQSRCPGRYDYARLVTHDELPRSWWHDGSKPGTTALALVTDDGTVVAALFNSRPIRGDVSADLDKVLRNWVSAAREHETSASR